MTQGPGHGDHGDGNAAKPCREAANHVLKLAHLAAFAHGVYVRRSLNYKTLNAVTRDDATRTAGLSGLIVTVAERDCEAWTR